MKAPIEFPARIGGFILFLSFLGCHSDLPRAIDGQPWPMHVISSLSSGADGVRLADFNRDGLPEVVTGWEEGGVVTVCFNPGAEKAGRPWPAVVCGRVSDVEDALAVDLDGDGRLEVVSCTEGETKTVYFHHLRADAADPLDQSSWQTEALAASRGLQQWMFCIGLQLDGRHGVDLVAGGKNENGAIGWFEAPREPLAAELWRWHPIGEVGWVMSIIDADMDHDGDRDLLISDRKGSNTGCRWLENPGHGPPQAERWQSHMVGAAGLEIMFIDLTDLDADGKADIVAAVRPSSLLWFVPGATAESGWRTVELPYPEDAGNAKSVRAADMDGDGTLDLVVTCELSGDRTGVFCIYLPHGPAAGGYRFANISGERGTKYDLAQCIDLDADGDLDVVTCEERENLGVIWYENPRR